MRSESGRIVLAAAAFNITAAIGVDALAQCKLDTLLASDGDGGDNFGIDIATAADTVLVGAWQHEHPDAGRFSGAAYVFDRNGAEWTEVQELLASDPSAFDNFGQAVAMDGDWAFIGAPGVNGQGTDRGAVYIFNRNAGVWAETEILAPDDTRDFHAFGISIDLDGDRAIIGASGDNDLGTGAGAVYIYERQGAVWTQQAKITASDGAAFDSFGTDVAVEGDRILTSALGAGGFGKAYVYDRIGPDWIEQGVLMPDEPERFDGFGWRIALRGDTAFIGAQSHDTGGEDVGGVFLFTGAGGWGETDVLFPGDPIGILNFGQAIAVRGDRMVIGGLDSAAGQGLAYVFRESNGRWTENARHEEFDQTFAQSVDLDAYAAAGAWARDTACVFDIELAGSLIFAFDPNRSVCEIEIQFPGQEVQVFQAHMTGTMTALFNADCGGLTTFQVPELNLQTIEPSFLVQLPDQTFVEVTDVQCETDRPGPPGDLVQNGNQYHGVLADYGIQILGNIGTDGEPNDEILKAALVCIARFFLIDISPGQESEVMFPGIDFSGVLDFGMGNMNPTIHVTGDLEGTAGPGSTPANLTDFSVVTGTLLGGDLPDLLASDDAYVHTRSGFGATFVDLHHMEMIVSAMTTADSPAMLDIAIESRVDEPAGLLQLGLRNWTAGGFDLIGSAPIGNSDETDRFNDIDATNYVDTNGNIGLSVKHIVFVPFLAFTFESLIDQIEILVE